METRPLCECHGEPMHKNGIRRGRQGWRCSIKNARAPEYRAEHQNNETRLKYEEAGYWKIRRLKKLEARRDIIVAKLADIENERREVLNAV